MKINIIFLFLSLVWHSSSNSQNIPYTGGDGSGYYSGILAISNCSQYYGGNADGAAANHSAITICPEYFGSTGDGYATGSSGCLIILPVKLITFYGEKESQRNILHWKTEDGYNVKQFEVEKSADGVSFTKAGTVAGNVNNQFSYLFIDTKPFPDISFYRLRIIERNGDISYSKIIVIKGGSQSYLAVYPNPTKGLATVYCYSNISLTTELIIYRPDGSIVLSRTLKIKPHENYINLDLQNLANGIYIIKIGETGTAVKIILLKN